MEKNRGFVEISKYAGMREDLVQAGGGNTSYKISDTEMLIKASGMHLSEVGLEEGYCIVNYKIISDFFKQGKNAVDIDEQAGKDLLQKCLVEGKFPSIETFLHAITGRYTLHTHPIVANIILMRKDAREIIQKLFPKSIFVDYAAPGVKLALKYYEQLEKTKECNIIFLKNHGMIVSGDSAKEVIEENEKALLILEEYLHLDMQRYHQATQIWQSIGEYEKILWLTNDINIQKFTIERNLAECNHRFCPDSV
ncbi:MAG: class II aldolase/adducin family protein, partial [Lachnospiraceae bacterium]|nr:class II aldolase/adducin family protein [Lachnospiraceae bacterium]